jgi:N-acetylmuramoyl-L-alanine amidase
MKIALTQRLAFIAALGLGASGFLASSASATQFSQRELDPGKVIAIASPVGNSSHQLLVLEQISNQRDCWQENGDVVEPLLLRFDFTGICSRGTDSNGYSIRVGGEDLGWQYRLQVVRDGSTLKLVGASNQNRNAPLLEIGRASLISNQLTRIELNPGWRLTKRVYNGQTLGHYYLTHDRPLSQLVAAAPTSRPVTPLPSSSPSPTPSTPRPTTPDLFPSTPRPVTPRPVTPGVYQGSPPSPSDQASLLGFRYRVIVPAPTVAEQNRVRAVVPGAFRTTIDGEVVMQTALYREEEDAEDFRDDLKRQGFEARILEIESGNSGDRPAPTPAPAPSPAPNPGNNLPQVPRGRYVVAIDPGHGGRDPGAVGIGSIEEADIVLDISRKLANALEQQGVRTVLTRRDDREIDLDPRITTAERANATVFVSVHANAISLSRPEVNGAETYYYASTEGYRLAQSIQSSIIRQTGMVDRGVREARFYVLRNTSMPAALVETGFVTGRDDAARLRDPNFRTRMAEAIAAGILNYLQ